MLEENVPLSKKNIKTKVKITRRRPKSPPAKSPNQKTYIQAIQNNDMVLCQGPAGTGKTHLAIGMAIYMYHTCETIDKIIIARPAVEAGESLGYLPGDLDSKLDPFIRPIFDELACYASKFDVADMRDSGIIEICPLAYMRGRTFKNAFIICDEAQNADKKQMKMLLTRLGEGSKLVVTGDIDQTDLCMHKPGAFESAFNLFDGDPGIACVTLKKCDIKRHKLVSHIVEKWEKNENRIDSE